MIQGLFSIQEICINNIAIDPLEHNRSVVLPYLKEVLDGKKIDLLNELFTSDVIMHRPEGKLSNLHQVNMFLGFGLSFITLETTIQDIFTSDNRVVIRLSHKAVFTEGAYIKSRLGTHNVGGKILV